jgi:xylulokinase
MHLLGLDIGTGGTRALIVDGQGGVVAIASEDHHAFASPHIGWAEQDPSDWWRAARVAIQKVLATSNLRAEQIDCIGFSGQMHGAVLLDGYDQVVRPAIIWCDQRTEPQSQELIQTLSAKRIIQLTCNLPLSNFTLTKLMWVRENEPDDWLRVRTIMLPKDYVRFQLTGERVTDVADASGTLLLDVAQRRWSAQMLDAVGLSTSLLPQLHESADICAVISRQGAAATGLKAGTPVVAGAGDQAAGAIGMGIAQAGTVGVTIGSSGVVFAGTDRPALDPQGRLHTFCHAVPNGWHVMGVTQAAGLSLRWFRDTFGAEEGEGDPYVRLCEEAGNAPAGAAGLLWTPYLMGERTPHLDPTATATLTGLTMSHGRAHIIRAILEGVAFSLRDTFSIMDELKLPIRNIRIGGGGARSPLWRQIQADVFGAEIAMLKAEQGAAYGAGILAGVGLKYWKSVEEACDTVVKVADSVAPDERNVALMNACYSNYRRIYPSIRSSR